MDLDPGIPSFPSLLPQKWTQRPPEPHFLPHFYSQNGFKDIGTSLFSLRFTPKNGLGSMNSPFPLSSNPKRFPRTPEPSFFPRFYPKRWTWIQGSPLFPQFYPKNGPRDPRTSLFTSVSHSNWTQISWDPLFFSVTPRKWTPVSRNSTFYLSFTPKRTQGPLFPSAVPPKWTQGPVFTSVLPPKWTQVPRDPFLPQCSPPKNGSSSSLEPPFSPLKLYPNVRGPPHGDAPN